jgi:hypothetical protein
MHDGSVIHEASAENYVVPADDKENARLIIAEIILDVFKGLKMAYPKSGAKRRRELRLIRKRLVK